MSDLTPSKIHCCKARLAAGLFFLAPIREKQGRCLRVHMLRLGLKCLMWWRLQDSSANSLGGISSLLIVFEEIIKRRAQGNEQ